MLGRRELLLSCAGGVLLACGPDPRQSPSTLAVAREHTTLGPGDIFKLEIVGEPDLPTEYQVAADGTVSLPYIHVIEVAGLEPQEVAAKVRQELIEQQILTDPSVVVTVQEYRSKRITILGQVQKPGSFPLTPGMSLLQAISQAGGLTAIANAARVNLTRTVPGGAAKTVVVNVEAIYEGQEEDIALQAGDRIYVHERVF